MKKRDLFAELTEGFDALALNRVGKQTLRTHEVEIKPTVGVTASELQALRQRLNLSRPVFARYLRTKPRTLENWEQGRAKPNAQAALLIRLVERFPDTMQRLEMV
ncbi:helix-turn-helix domain-containing protein [Giesbergeria anulus]|uniref:Putative transcriptional regulator n=1 Tax=Giesbergeria anulus TaxID=180197 RepID=A0A1H9Q8S9_9BURK|nr:transcriptional regulator [Giesbergeria anulus]SER56798.1 putative transcriptional regulator [Giesbergeria anulus]